MKDLQEMLAKAGHPSPDMFPFSTVLCFQSLLARWQTESSVAQEQEKTLNAHIQQYADAHPFLREPISDLASLEPHQDWVQMLLNGLFPRVASSGKNLAVMPPFKTLVLHQTEGFRDLMSGDTLDLSKMTNLDSRSGSMNLEGMIRFKITIACLAILSKEYGFQDLFFHSPMSYRVPDVKTGTYRYYRTVIDPSLVSIKVQGRKPNIRREQVDLCLREMDNMAGWLELVNPAKFQFEGLMLFELVDITEEESFLQIQQSLLGNAKILDRSCLAEVEKNMQDFFGLQDLHLGLAAMDPAGNLLRHSHNDTDLSPLLAGCDFYQNCATALGSVYQRMVQSRQPQLIEDLAQVAQPTELERRLLSKNIRNILLCPLEKDGQLIGFVELTSPQPNRIHALHALRFRRMLPMLRMALQRALEDWTNEMQAVIKDHFTAIHPVVEWKFEESAKRYLEQRNPNQTASLPPIRFHGVYPLFGQSDIRHSNDQRNTAVQEDLSEQLRLAAKVLEASNVLLHLPALDELDFRIGRYRSRLKRRLLASDEGSIQDFIIRDIHPLFAHLETVQPAIRPALATYRAALDPETQFVNKRRRQYEESLNRLNDNITRMLELHQAEAQQIFPHYFERYKTDGVEYNIYVGQSLVPGKPFDPLYLHNLRLWQLHSLARIAQQNAVLRDQLSVPLETAQLILVHSNPLDILFRMDEKRFDVEGGYNVRYEIIKKRLDKATVEGSGERITQVGKVTIAFESERDIAEYKRYAEYLQFKGVFSEPIEYLRIEPLQGVQGMQAMRLTVAVSPAKPESINLAELLERTERAQ
ncbi:MAG: hypothetical protein GC205_02460 [Bacteroidetes bacterium]|nr:hypothetical protein [Bacteroidota bacterium]